MAKDYKKMVSMILTECGKGDCTEMDVGCIKSSFQDTLKGLDKASLTYTIDSVPIFTFKGTGTQQKDFDIDDPLAGTMGNPGYGMDDDNPELLQGPNCKDGCCESYIVDYEMLCNLVESYSNIYDVVDAHKALCYHNNIDEKSLGVVFENANDVSNAISRLSRSGGDLSFFDNYNKGLNGLMQAGVKCYSRK